MKAFQLFKHNREIGSALKPVEIDRPTHRANEVLIEVKAAGVNPLDNMITRGDVKLLTPYNLPLTMGNECSGVVVEVGVEVKDFKVGDKVFARLPIQQIGAFAEYVAIPEVAVAHMPEGMSYVEATSIPLTALTAYQALDLMQPMAGKTIFISGGSGGLGAMAIPLAKSRGLIVYTNGNASSRERVLALGADQYIDYKKEDYLKVLDKTDYVLDSLGGKELERQMQLLTKGGRIVSLKGLPNGRFASRFGLPKWKQWLLALVGHRIDKKANQLGVSYDFLFVEANGKQLAEVAQLIVDKSIPVSVSKVFPFEQTNEALAYLDQGGVSGKVVLSMD